MLYNKSEFHSYVSTAGKITVATALFGVVAFTLIFLLNIGANELKQVDAQGLATTSITVLNTPPYFTSGPGENPESSTSSPTNSGDTVTWSATAVDPSGEDYYLLICNGKTASPTASQGNPPVCGAGDMMWARSAIASSGDPVTAATTTLEAFAEQNDWYAWVCDDVANARCNIYPSQGDSGPTAATSSPFVVNHRPGFTGFWNNSPADPGATVTFSATSTDPDSYGGQDNVRLHVCSTASFTGGACDATTLASSSLTHPDPQALYTLATVMQDDDYPAYGYIVDEHGHEAQGLQGTGGFDLTVNNVAPFISSTSISVYDGNIMNLTEGVETADNEFYLDFVVTDYNSCDSVVGPGVGDEFSTSTLSVFRSGIGSTTCDGTGGSYDPNNCYPSGVGVSTWNLQCTASTTTCAGASDSTMTVECEFPLWFIADPTTGASTSDSYYWNQVWTAAASASDDDFATSTFTMAATSTAEVEVLLALNMLNSTIPYGALEPGQDTGTLSTTTAVQTTGNAGIDEGLQGTNMCPGYTSGSSCALTAANATHTIPVYEQEFATSELAYGSGTALATGTQQTLDINILKATSTSIVSSKDTYWGIAVPSVVTYAAAYSGENTFTAVLSHPNEWY